MLIRTQQGCGGADPELRERSFRTRGVAASRLSQRALSCGSRPRPRALPPPPPLPAFAWAPASPGCVEDAARAASLSMGCAAQCARPPGQRRSSPRARRGVVAQLWLLWTRRPAGVRDPAGAAEPRSGGCAQAGGRRGAGGSAPGTMRPHLPPSLLLLLLLCAAHAVSTALLRGQEHPRPGTYAGWAGGGPPDLKPRSGNSYPHPLQQ